MPQQSIGPYKIIGKLGEGGMGEVFEAMHETIERRVAIKLLHPDRARDREVAARFLNEARAVNRIEHTGLVQISDCNQTSDGSIYIVMELLRGATLGQRLKERGRLTPAEAVMMCRQISSALVAVHDKGIVHRDLKPENLMLVNDPETPGRERVKILDFGIAEVGPPAARQLPTDKPRLFCRAERFLNDCLASRAHLPPSRRGRLPACSGSRHRMSAFGHRSSTVTRLGCAHEGTARILHRHSHHRLAR